MAAPIDQMLNSVEDAVLCLNQHSEIVWLNEPAAALFGCPRALALGRPSSQFDTLAPLVRQLPLSDLAANPAARLTQRVRLERPTREPIPLEVSVSQLAYQGERLITAVFRDVTPLLQMEQAVYESRKTQALAALTGGIAHDFNNILTAVISQLDLALHAPEFPAALRQHLLHAQTSARRGAELVSRLQTFSGQSKPELAPLNPADVVEQVIFMLKRSIDPKITIEGPPSSAPRPWVTRADSQQVAQALLNLAINARDAMPQGGRLGLELENVRFTAPVAAPRRAGEFVRLTVADTGAGIPPDVVNRLFEPCFTTKDRSRGAGLGLSIAAAVVAEHAGWMEVTSKPGAGSRFSIFLPRCEEPGPGAVPKPRLLQESSTTEGKERILLVDDEELVRLVTKAVLSYRGYQVEEAADGQEAVERYQAAPTQFHLVVMDMHMPRMNGYDAIVRIKAINPAAKFIMLSGGVHEVEPGAAQLASTAFLHKPFDNQELVQLVRQVLDGR
jgi:PAS domain S-box-containing protein